MRTGSCVQPIQIILHDETVTKYIEKIKFCVDFTLEM